jgi:flagellar hook protein FlgE
MYTALSGLNTFNEALSVVSDNIANANTTGWKSNFVDFGDLVAGLIPTENINTTAQGVGSSVIGVTSDFNTGSEIQTGNWSDVMIQGNGFFAVEDPTSKAIYYTRDGSFMIDTKGFLTDMNGNQVLETDGKTPIQITNPSQYTSFSIDKFGNLTGTTSTPPPTQLGQIGVATFSNPNGLIRNGKNEYVWGTSAGAATYAAPGTGQAGELISGALEGSNVDLTAQMVDLITYQADYQANSKSIETGNNLLQTVVNLIR